MVSFQRRANSAVASGIKEKEEEEEETRFSKVSGASLTTKNAKALDHRGG